MKLEYLFKDNVYKSVDRLPEWLKNKEDICMQIRSLRTLLGMTQEQLARRSSQSDRLIRNLESSNSDPHLSTLMKTAEGLGCELVVRFVPKERIMKLMRQRAEKKAREIIQLSAGNAAMEGQEPRKAYIKHQVKELTDELLNKKPSLLWED